MVSTSEDVQVTRVGDWLLARFTRPQRCLSWAIVGGGFCDTEQVSWMEVRNADLPPGVDPRALLSRRMQERGLSGVGLLTSRALDAYVQTSAQWQDVRATCIATVGLGNALRAGDPLCDVRPVGTINVLCHVSVPLCDEALLEGIALMSEAKALAVREGQVVSIASGAPASGTGTDCLVISSPPTSLLRRSELYAGKHTAVGHVIGAAVAQAIARGVAEYTPVMR